MSKQKITVRQLCIVGFLAALSYVCFTFLQIKIPLPGGDLISIHVGNAVPVLGALLFGGWFGALGGAIGMTIGDLFDPVYIVYAPHTFVLKFCIGLASGIVAQHVFKIAKQQDTKKRFRAALISSMAGLGLNVILYPLTSYFYKILILGKLAADVSLVWNFAISLLNAGICTVVATAAYMALRPALEKSGLLKTHEKHEK